jgi:hypothetical protein
LTNLGNTFDSWLHASRTCPASMYSQSPLKSRYKTWHDAF